LAINVDLVADASKAIRESGKLGDALDKVTDSLDDIGDQGKTIDDKVQDAFRGMAHQAKAAGKTIGDDVKHGTKRAGEGLEELKSESAGTAREAAASFGSIEDAADALQETAANALAGFGPAGAAAGIAVAAGIGLAITAAQQLAETNNEAKQRAVDMVDAIAEANGNLGDLNLSDKIKSWGREVLEDNWMTFWADESSTKFQETAKDAEAYGVSAKDAIRAAAGSAEDSQKFLDETADAWQVLQRRVDEGTTTNESGAVSLDAGAEAAQRQLAALSDLRGQAESNIKTTQDAVDIYGLEADAMDNSAEATERANQALVDRAAALDAQATGAMSADQAELDYIATLEQSTADIATNGVTVDAHTAAGRANRQTLIEMATSARTLIEAQIAQGDSTSVVTARTNDARTAFINAATSAGFTKDEARKLADQYGLIPGNVDTYVKAHDVQKTKDEIDGLAAPRHVPIHLEPYGAAEVANYITGMNGQKVYVDIAPRGGVGITN
jgi:hypothetical protein